MSQRIAIIANPIKFDDLDEIKAQIEEELGNLGCQSPIWLVTTEDDPGVGQTAQALEQGADVVCPLGGDGTVRVVAGELVGTGTPLGLLPGGTGNLLARNLDLPIDSLSECLRIAVGGSERTIDTGTLTLRGGDADGVEHAFAVMAGLGLDADIMNDAPEALKNTVGWSAYLASGVRHLWGERFAVTVDTDHDHYNRRTRMVTVGNCGTLQGGVQLIPDARLDDGELDVLTLSPRGAIHWVSVAAYLASRQHKGHPTVQRNTATEVSVRTDRPIAVQVDGDVLGKCNGFTAKVLPASLVVRAPAEPSED